MDWVNGMKAFISRLPIFSVLVNLSRAAMKGAAIQLLLNVIFSTLPVWFFAIIFSIPKHYNDPNNSYIYAAFLSAISAISNGELFMYTTATIGPLFYTAMKYQNPSDRPFPRLLSLAVISILISLFATSVYIVSKLYALTSKPGIIFVSFLCYIFAISILFSIMAFDHEQVKRPMEAMREDENDFQQGYSSHRGS